MTKMSTFINRYFVGSQKGSCDGENRKNYDIWVTPDDLGYIPEIFIDYTLKHLNKGTIMDVFGSTEQELFERLIDDKNCINYVSENPVFYIDKNLNVYPNITNVSPYWLLGNLRDDGIETIIMRYKNNKTIAQHITEA